MIYFNYLFRKYQNICFTIGLSLKMHETPVNTLGNKPLPDMLYTPKTNRDTHNSQLQQFLLLNEVGLIVWEENSPK